MKVFFAAFLLSLFLMIDLRAQTSESANTDLTFVGIVTEVAASPIKNSDLNWVVSAEIQTVETGNFDGKKFSFRVHSPGRAGLVVGKRYRFHAVKADRGYTIDESQIEQQK